MQAVWVGHECKDRVGKATDAHGQAERDPVGGAYL